MQKLLIYHKILISIIKITNQLYDINQPYNFTHQPEDIIYKEMGHYLLNISVHPMQYTYMKYPLIVESFNEIPYI